MTRHGYNFILNSSLRLKCDFMHVKGREIISKYTKWYRESWPEMYFNAFTAIKPMYIKPLRWMIISYCEHSMISSLKTLFSRWILLVECRNFMCVFSSSERTNRSWTNADTIVNPFSFISTRLLSAASKEITEYFFKHINHFLHTSAPPFTSDLNIRSPWCSACAFLRVYFVTPLEYIAVTGRARNQRSRAPYLSISNQSFHLCLSLFCFLWFLVYNQTWHCWTFSISQFH